MLRERLVCSVQDEHIQRGLLPEKGLDCKKAMEIAHGMEVAAKNATDIQAMNASVFPQGREEKVHKVWIYNQQHKQSRSMTSTGNQGNCDP